MPWSTPTLEQLRSLNRDNIQAQLRSGPMVPNSVLRVMADSNAGLAYLTMLYIDWLSNQFLPDTAETEWLDRHAAIWLSQPRKTATFASGSMTVTGIPGTVVPAGSQLTLGNGNVSFILATLSAVTIGAGGSNVNFAALVSGATGLSIGSSMLFSTGIAGVDGNAIVATVTDGIDGESDDELRARVLARIQKPPMGGDADDYVAWALEVPGVTRAWSYPNEMGIGTVTVRFLMDDVYPDNHGIPLASDVATVLAYMDTKRPVAVKGMFVQAPIPQFYDITIGGLHNDSSATRAAIEAAIRSMELSRSLPGQTMFRSWVDEAISGAVGEDSHELTFTTQVMPGNGYMPVLRNITYS